MKRTCGTCKWGEFEMSRHEKPRPLNVAGYCRWPVNLPDLPLSITIGFVGGLAILPKGYVWPHWTNCPVWEAKE